MATTKVSGPPWLRELQEQVGQWSTANFGTEQPPEYPLIGAGEEIGELTTSVLKQAQGIGDSEKYDDIVGPEAEKDAVGDVMIYLLDTIYRAEDDDISVSKGLGRVDSVPDRYDHIEDEVDIIRMLYTEYGRLSGKRLYLIPDEEWGDPDKYDWKEDEDRLDMVELNVGEVAAVLRRFCEIRGYDFKECVLDAWEEVSGRKWDATIADT